MRPLSCGFDSSVGRALNWHRRGRRFESRSEPEFFQVFVFFFTAAPALMTVSKQLLLMDEINFTENYMDLGLHKCMGVFLKHETQLIQHLYDTFLPSKFNLLVVFTYNASFFKFCTPYIQPWLPNSPALCDVGHVLCSMVP